MFDDETVIKGYMYKTAQSVGFFQLGDYFIRRYYVLNKLTKVLTIYEKPGGKAQHTLDLSTSLAKVNM